VSARYLPSEASVQVTVAPAEAPTPPPKEEVTPPPEVPKELLIGAATVGLLLLALLARRGRG